MLDCLFEKVADLRQELGTVDGLGDIVVAPIEVACFPSDASLRAVAVEGTVQDRAAYADLNTCSDNEIAERGVKLG